MLNPARAESVAKPWASVYVGALYVVAVTLVLHVLFSWMGFFFSDDGMNLAFARRIVEGQVPHRDFISLRPAGTALLFAPFVKYGGEHVFVLSRLFVFFQYTFISWAWVRLFVSQAKISLSLFSQVVFALVCLLFSLNTFQVVASYTIDGFFFISLGLLMWARRDAFWNQFFAYACMGLAVVCKQSYIFFVVVIPFVLRGYKDFRVWAALLFPMLSYTSIMGALGALPDFIEQMTAQKALFQYAFAHFFKNSLFWAGVIVGGLAGVVAQKRIQTLPFYFIAVCALAFFSALGVALYNRIFPLSYATSGGALGVFVWLLAKYGRQDPLVRWGFAALLLAWCSSLSLACLPVLYGWGLLLQFLFAASYYLDIPKTTQKFSLFGIGLLLLSAALLLYARHRFVFYQCSAKELVCPMEGLLKGWKGIKVHPKTFARIQDLNMLLLKFSGQTYTILPNFAAHWVTSEQTNPLPEDWVMGNELNAPSLINRMMNVLAEHRGKTIFIIQKFESTLSAIADVPLLRDLPGHKDYQLIAYYIKENFNKIDETDFYEVYK